jgi:hypothetical protein
VNASSSAGSPSFGGGGGGGSGLSGFHGSSVSSDEDDDDDSARRTGTLVGAGTLPAVLGGVGSIIDRAEDAPLLGVAPLSPPPYV